MKTVIVRTPETDRKLIEIPTGISDLDDPAGTRITVVTALARLVDEVAGSGFRDVSAPVPFDFWDSENNVTRVTGGFVVGAAGLYIINAEANWESVSFGPSAGNHPNEASRASAVVVNGTDYYFLNKSDYGAGGAFARGKDAGTQVLSLAEGDEVVLELSWDSTIDTVASGGDVTSASLHLYRLP